MDTWKFFDIIHKEHALCNPTSLDKLDQLISLLRLPQTASILEIASGKGEFALRMAEQYGISGVAVDISPFCAADAKNKQRDREGTAGIRFVEAEGAAYVSQNPAEYDLSACIGASWIFEGHRGTLEELSATTRAGGVVVVGEPFWLQEPDPEYLQAAGFEKSTFGSHRQNVRVGERLGLTLLYAMVSNHDDWDRYEGLQWYAAENYASEHPDDPDNDELLRRVMSSKDEYLRWGRDTLGWAIYVFRKDS